MADSSTHRLHRSTTDRVIAGVCGGLGEYFDVDPVLVRLAFVVGAVLGHGIAIPIYIVLWIVLPKQGSETVRRAELWRENADELVGEARRVGAEVREAIRPSRPPEAAPETAEEPIDAATAPMSEAPSEPPPSEPPLVTPPPRPAPRPSTYQHRQMLVGIVLVLAGLWLLADNLDLLGWFRGDLLWPLVLLGVGAWLLLRQTRGGIG